MEAPLDKTIVITPLANCWREGRFVCIENLNCDRNVDNVRIHYKILEEAFPDTSACWLKKFPDCEAFPFAVRELAAQMVPRRCEAVAIVAPSASIPALRLSYSLVKVEGVKLELFHKEHDARRWLNLQCG
jgi:hypothetical protein